MGYKERIYECLKQKRFLNLKNRKICKIGLSENPIKRIKQIQQETKLEFNFFELVQFDPERILHTEFLTSKHLERLAQNCFAQDWIIGEYYYLDIANIKENKYWQKFLTTYNFISTYTIDKIKESRKKKNNILQKKLIRNFIEKQLKDQILYKGPDLYKGFISQKNSFNNYEKKYYLGAFTENMTKFRPTLDNFDKLVYAPYKWYPVSRYPDEKQTTTKYVDTNFIYLAVNC